MRQKLWPEGWEYPLVGVYFANDPSGGHTLFALDYRECEKNGEPKVVFVEQEPNFKIAELTPGFETFIRCLRYGDGPSGK